MGVYPIKRKPVRIHIGQYHADREPCTVYTMLGSCVATCLYDPVGRVGGMNHILLPGEADLDRFDLPARYGIQAMELLINRIMSLGGHRARLRAKVFGGARLLDSVCPDHAIGRKNIEFVLSFLEKEAIPVAAHDLGGDRSRRIYFHTDTGEVFLKRGKPVHLQAVISQEREKIGQVHRAAQQPGRITWFDPDTKKNEKPPE